MCVAAQGRAQHHMRNAVWPSHTYTLLLSRSLLLDMTQQQPVTLLYCSLAYVKGMHMPNSCCDTVGNEHNMHAWQFTRECIMKATHTNHACMSSIHGTLPQNLALTLARSSCPTMPPPASTHFSLTRPSVTVLRSIPDRA